jgi:hypothetical protein
MTSLEFQSTLFRTERDMLDAIAREWLSASGANDRETMQEFLAEHEDEMFAAECITNWGLDQRVRDDDEQTWMEARGVEEFDLIQAFARLRANFEHVFPAEAA